MQQTGISKQNARNWKNSINCLMGLIISVSATSCRHTNIEPCDSEMVRYGTDIRPIISKSCAFQGCHNSTNSLGNFNNYDELNAKCNDGSFQKRVFWKKDMPPSKIDTCDFIRLKKWFNEGHKRN